MDAPFANARAARWLSALPAAVALLGRGGSPAHAQAPSLLPPAAVVPGDFGVPSIEAVRRGSVAIVYAPEGPRLEVRSLRTSLRPAPSPADPSSEAASSAGAGGALRVDAGERGRRGGAGVSARGAARSGGRSGEAPSARALWVWNTAELVGDRAARDAFLVFVEARGFDRVFLQLPPARGTRADAGFVPFDGERLLPLLAGLGERGVRVDALDGDPAYALPANHAGVVRTVRRVADHNRGAPPGARFHGVRLDVEPYLLPGFQGPRREAILDGYAGLVGAVARAAEEDGLAFGLDVPFWFDAPDEETGLPLTVAAEGGGRRPLLPALLERVDDIAVMDYRTRAYGENGALALVRDELALAERSGVGVLVGVETSPLPDEDVHRFAGPARTGLPPAGGRHIVLAPTGDGAARAWIVEGAAALEELGVELEARAIPAGSVVHWAAGPPRRVAGDDLSFHGPGADALEREVERIFRGLAGHPAFRGVAYHHYGSLRALLARGVPEGAARGGVERSGSTDSATPRPRW